MVIIYRDGFYCECEVSEKDELISLYGWSDHQTNKSLIGHELKKHPNPFTGKINKKTIAPVVEVEQKVNDVEEVSISKLSWNNLRAYGKDLEQKYNVSLPLGSKRAEIEKAIEELLNKDK